MFQFMVKMDMSVASFWSEDEHGETSSPWGQKPNLNSDRGKAVSSLINRVRRDLRTLPHGGEAKMNFDSRMLRWLQSRRRHTLPREAFENIQYALWQNYDRR
ncbi:hypothetical protein HAX54_052576 [Datura stramonium]|uniref:Uncharacterized protein n=1 Tax=Datura stramonium TaxID=4076 RepID=A0ABS8WQT8_DATST|nr:hypothetical protein [Datura stramonium]